jgi:nanoRNase/pAp phosphatase (c-di-AMP/oligoRNAs hydrolase)/DNA-binding XRE family transcriptional regulator
MMDDEVTFGEWFRRRRRGLDLTQKELARRVGCGVTTIRKIEAGERRPSKELAAQLAIGLEVAPEEYESFITFARLAPYPDQPPPLAPTARPPSSTSNHIATAPLPHFLAQDTSPPRPLFEAVAGLSRLLILPHNDPDPDAIAGAVALRYLLAQGLNIEGRIAYQGIIGRAENKALVRYLGHPLRRLKDSDLHRADAVALIDTQPGAGNNPLPPGRSPTIVIDHHPWREETAAAAFAEVRPDIGATSTILTDYLKTTGIEPTPPLATALFYGIKTDTMGLGRGASASDTAAYFYLQPRIDVDALVEIERAQVPAEYFRSFDIALRAARVYDDVVIAYIGQMDYPDLVAEMADLLLRLEGTRWVICMGAYQGELVLSVRTRGRRSGAGRLAQGIVESRGTAGGHGAMAGGHLQLRGEDPAQVATQLGQRVLQLLKIPVGTPGKTLI